MAAIDEFNDVRATEHLKIAWVALGMDFHDRTEEWIGPDGVEVIPVDLNRSFKAIVFAFPTPTRLTEAFFAAMVYPNEVKQDVRTHYYTLEYNPDRPCRTFVSQWEDEGLRFNLGGGPEPSVERFVEFLVEKFPEVATPPSDEADLTEEQRLARKMLEESEAKSELTRLIDSRIQASGTDGVVMLKNIDALQIFFTALRSLKLVDRLNFSGFYLSPKATRSLLERFERARDNARYLRSPACEKLDAIIETLESATDSEHRDLAFVLAISKLPDASATSRVSTIWSRQKSRDARENGRNPDA